MMMKISRDDDAEYEDVEGEDGSDVDKWKCCIVDGSDEDFIALSCDGG